MKEKSLLTRDLLSMDLPLAQKVSKVMTVGTTNDELVKWILVNCDKTKYELLSREQINITTKLKEIVEGILEYPEPRFKNKEIIIMGNTFFKNKDNGHWLCLIIDKTRRILNVFDSFGNRDGQGAYTIPDLDLEIIQMNMCSKTKLQLLVVFGIVFLFILIKISEKYLNIYQSLLIKILLKHDLEMM
jgi:hypothetical protein